MDCIVGAEEQCYNRKGGQGGTTFEVKMSIERLTIKSQV